MKVSFDQFKGLFEILSPTMNDYLYILDMKNDAYCISENAVERFRLPASEFQGVTEGFRNLVYHKDLDMLNEDLAMIFAGKKDTHNLQYRWIAKDGGVVWINCRGRVVCGENGEREYMVGCINEIGKKQIADNISGLLGEYALHEVFREHENGDMHGFMLRLGIDDFKEINEKHGMEYGDMVLVKTAECIGRVIEPGQQIFRIVADEFAVVDFETTDMARARQLYINVRKEIDRFIEDNGYEVFYTISGGIVDFSEVEAEDHPYDEVMRWSEFALNEAKFSGKNECSLFNREDYSGFLDRRKLRNVMRRAVNNDCAGFEVYFQPIMDMRENRITSAEALLRFHTSDGRMMSPVRFIPILEESGLIIPVGKWVVRQALSVCSHIRKTIPDFRVNVNFSYIQIQKSDVLADILSCLKEFDLPEDCLVVELTESGNLENDAKFQRFCDGLGNHEMLLALDDFGTGYSNFHYLYSMKTNTIKLDRTFVVKALRGGNEYNLLQHMVDMTHSLQLHVCIEGIETESELAQISEVNPEFIQGYYFSRPIPVKELYEKLDIS